MERIIKERIKRLERLLGKARTREYHSEALRDIDITAYSSRIDELHDLLMIIKEKGP